MAERAEGEDRVIEGNSPPPDIGDRIKRWQLEVARRAVADGRPLPWDNQSKKTSS